MAEACKSKVIIRRAIQRSALLRFRSDKPFAARCRGARGSNPPTLPSFLPWTCKLNVHNAVFPNPVLGDPQMVHVFALSQLPVWQSALSLGGCKNMDRLGVPKDWLEKHWDGWLWLRSRAAGLSKERIFYMPPLTWFWPPADPDLDSAAGIWPPSRHLKAATWNTSTLFTDLS